jgi:hypothetical protein
MWATLQAFENNNLERVNLVSVPKCGQTRLFDHGRENIASDQIVEGLHVNLIGQICV